MEGPSSSALPILPASATPLGFLVSPSVAVLMLISFSFPLVFLTNLYSPLSSRIMSFWKVLPRCHPGSPCPRCPSWLRLWCPSLARSCCVWCSVTLSSGVPLGRVHLWCFQTWQTEGDGVCWMCESNRDGTGPQKEPLQFLATNFCYHNPSQIKMPRWENQKRTWTCSLERGALHMCLGISSVPSLLSHFLPMTADSHRD